MTADAFEYATRRPAMWGWPFLLLFLIAGGSASSVPPFTDEGPVLVAISAMAAGVGVLGLGLYAWTIARDRGPWRPLRVDSRGIRWPGPVRTGAARLVPWAEFDGLVVFRLNRTRFLSLVLTPEVRAAEGLRPGPFERRLGIAMDDLRAVDAWPEEVLREIADAMARHSDRHYLVDLTTLPATVHLEGPHGSPRLPPVPRP